jgi:hypothetical protein
VKEKSLVISINTVLQQLADVERQLLALRQQLLLSPPEEPMPTSNTAPTQASGTHDTITRLVCWLQARGITMKHHKPATPLDATCDRLALRLGEHFETLRPLYDAIKRRVAGCPYPTSVAMKDAAPPQISMLVQFGLDLHKHGFLKTFRYDRHLRLAYFQPQDAGAVTNFFTGAWLERYVLFRTQAALRGQHAELEILTNPQVVLPNGRDFELDILACTPAGILWLECKTGSNYPEFVSRYGHIARQYLRLPADQCAMVLLEPLSEDEKLSNAALAGMSVLNLADLDTFLARIARA